MNVRKKFRAIMAGKRLVLMPGAYDATFGFHLATMQFATEQLWKAYPQDIRAWIDRHGGLAFFQILWMQAPETYRFFRKCADDERPR